MIMPHPFLEKIPPSDTHLLMISCLTNFISNMVDFFVPSADLQSPEIIGRKRPLEPTPDKGDLQPRTKRKRVEAPGETTVGATGGVAAPQEFTSRTSRVAPVVSPVNDYSTPSSFQGGRLSSYLPNWIQMGAPNYILNTLKGYKLPFVKKPPLVRLSPNRTSFQTTGMRNEILKMVDQRILESSDQSSGFLSKCSPGGNQTAN
nr:unnamed protein product [Callosobruchus analis]